MLFSLFFRFFPCVQRLGSGGSCASKRRRPQALNQRPCQRNDGTGCPQPFGTRARHPEGREGQCHTYLEIEQRRCPGNHLLTKGEGTLMLWGHVDAISSLPASQHSRRLPVVNPSPFREASIRYLTPILKLYPQSPPPKPVLMPTISPTLSVPRKLSMTRT